MKTLQKFFEGSNQNTIESLKSQLEERGKLIEELTVIAFRYQVKIYPFQNAYVDDLIKRAQKVTGK